MLCITLLFSGCVAPEYSIDKINIQFDEGEQDRYYDADVLITYNTDAKISKEESDTIANELVIILEESLDTDVKLTKNYYPYSNVGIKIKNFAILSESGWYDTYSITLPEEVDELTVFFPDTFEYKDSNTNKLPHVIHKYSPELSLMLFQSEHRVQIYDECAELFNWELLNEKFASNILHFTTNGLFNSTLAQILPSIGIPFEEIKVFNDNVAKFQQDELETWKKHTGGLLSAPFVATTAKNGYKPFWHESAQMSKLIQSHNELIKNTVVKNTAEDTADYYDNLKDLEENLEQQHKKLEIMGLIVSNMDSVGYSNSEIDIEFIVLAKNIVSTDKEYVKEQLNTVRTLQSE